MTTYIYGLIDPTVHKVSYIGRTINLYERLDAHIDEVAKTIKGDWIRRLRASGLRPTLVVLDSFEDGPADAIEQWWIEFGRRAGWPLTNMIGIHADKYNLKTLPFNGGSGFWENGEWIRDEDWYQLPAVDDEEDLDNYA